MPIARLHPRDEGHAPRMPLGDSYRGHCHADRAEIFEPSESDQQALCNCGYARGRCSRLPASGADAVRFSVADDHGGVVRLIWILESGHAPDAFGLLEYSIAVGELAGSADRLISAQAQAFLDSYLLNRAQR